MSNVYQSELSYKNKFGRFIWEIVQVTIFRFSPRQMHYWRLVLLRLFGAKINRSAKVYGTARIWAPWNLEMGAGAILGDRVDCYSVAPICIGAKAVASQDSCLCAATHDHRSDAFTLISKPIIIEGGAWVAARAFIGPGVRIGEGAVVGAAAVVFKDVLPETTMVGNPAKIIRSI